MNEKKNIALRKKIVQKNIDKFARNLKLSSESNLEGRYSSPAFGGVYNIGMSKAPEWFKNWSTGFETRNNKRFDTLESKVDKNTESIKENTESIKRLDKRVTKLDGRITNLVEKNDLKE